MAEASAEVTEIAKKTKSKRGPPSKTAAPPQKTGRQRDPIPRTMTFLDRIARIDRADWGTRAKLKLYRLEPMIDRLRGSPVKYITMYEEPVGEERIKADHGSGRYQLRLYFKAPAGEEKEMDVLEFDILDLAYPPKINRGEWVEDPRNAKYAFIKKQWEAEDKAAAELAARPTGSAVIRETVDTAKALKELFAPEAPAASAPAGNSVLDTLAIIKGVREMNPPTPPATNDTLLNTVVALMTKQLETQASELKELRAEMRKPAAETGGLGSVKSILGELKEFLPAIREVFPGAGEAIAGAVAPRSKMNGWQEFFQPILPTLGGALQPLVAVLAQRFVAPNGWGAQPAAPAGGATQLNGARPPAPAGPPTIIDFLEMVSPAMLNHFGEWLESGSSDWNGAGFADWIDNGYGERWKGIDWHGQAIAYGADAILLVYKTNVPDIWNRILGPSEPKFREFLRDFLAWQRPAPVPAGAPAPQEEFIEI
jgi:hypothetical protein